MKHNRFRALRGLFLWCLIVSLTFSLTAPAAAAGKQHWKVMHKLDVFGDETEELYLINGTPFTGTFNTAELSDVPLTANLLVDEHTVCLELWRYGTDKVKFSEDCEYDVRIKASDGTVYYTEGYADAGDTSLEIGFFLIVLSGESSVIDLGAGREIKIDDFGIADAVQVFRLLCEKDSQIKIYLEDQEHPAVNYLLTVETGDFGELYYEQMVEPTLAAYFARAEEVLGEGRYSDAQEMFTRLIPYRDSAERAGELKNSAQYEKAETALKEGRYREAWELFSGLGDYRDSAEQTEAVRELLFGTTSAQVGTTLDANRSESQLLTVFSYEDNAEGSLRQVLANAEDGAVITFADGIDRIILSDALSIEKRITLQLSRQIITAQYYTDSDVLTVFKVMEGGELVLRGEGTISPVILTFEASEVIPSPIPFAVTLEAGYTKDGGKLTVEDQVSFTTDNDTAVLIGVGSRSTLVLTGEGNIQGGACGVKALVGATAYTVRMDMRGRISSKIAVSLSDTPAVSITSAELEGVFYAMEAETSLGSMVPEGFEVVAGSNAADAVVVGPEQLAAAPNPSVTYYRFQAAITPLNTPEPIWDQALEPSQEPTSEQITPMLRDTITDDMLGGAVRPKDESWFDAPRTGRVVNAWVVALHWGPGNGYYENLALHADDEVEMLAEENGWILIRTTAGQYRWADSIYLQEIESSPVR